jgi:hypothetical protein
MAISGDIFIINEVYELIQDDLWPKEPYIRANETYGWFAGGGGTISLVQRINFNSDTENSSTRGNLNSFRSSEGEGNLNYGWITAGTSPSPSAYLCSVDRITYASDTSLASSRSTLLVGRNNHTITGNDNFAWIAGGFINPSTGNPVTSNIERLNYNDDTNSTSNRGNCDLRIAGGSFKTLEIGWFVGGQVNLVTTSSTERIIFSTDTEITSTRGNLSLSRWNLTATENNEYGWAAGGIDPSPSRYSTIDRMTFASDTSTASVRGPLTTLVSDLASCSNNDYGWFGGGSQPGARSTIVRITFNSDTEISSVRGSLSTAAQAPTATEGII